MLTREELQAIVRFLGGTILANGDWTVDQKKYHAAYRCEQHRQDPWRDIDTEIDCFVCLKQQLARVTAELHELKEVTGNPPTESAAEIATRPLRNQVATLTARVTKLSDALRELQAILTAPIVVGQYREVLLYKVREALTPPAEEDVQQEPPCPT